VGWEELVSGRMLVTASRHALVAGLIASVGTGLLAGAALADDELARPGPTTWRARGQRLDEALAICWASRAMSTRPSRMPTSAIRGTT